MDTIIQHLPGELSGFTLTLALSLLIGFEREEHDSEGPGGVRTFPIIGLSGFLLAVAFPESPIPFAAGLIVLGLLIALTHWATVRAGEGGITTEVTALLTFTIGGAAAGGFYWISIASGIFAVILLQEKTRLETWATRIPTHELRTLAHFMVLTACHPAGGAQPILHRVRNQPIQNLADRGRGVRHLLSRLSLAAILARRSRAAVDGADRRRLLLHGNHRSARPRVKARGGAATLLHWCHRRRNRNDVRPAVGLGRSFCTSNCPGTRGDLLDHGLFGGRSRCVPVLAPIKNGSRDR